MSNQYRAYRVELKLNNKQRSACRQHAGTARFAYNWGLAQCLQEREAGNKRPSAMELHKRLNLVKKTEFTWMYEVSKCAPQEALRDLDQAFKHFFRRVKNGEKPGFPRFKKKGLRESFRLTGSIRVEHKRVKLPRLGWLRLKEHGYIPTDLPIASATVSERAGRWFVSVLVKIQLQPIARATGTPVGVDLGVKTLATCSDGQRFENPKALRNRLKQLARLQRKFSRQQKGSQNRAKTKYKIAGLHYKIASIRQDALHKATTAITAKTKHDSERPAAIVIENLNVAGMVKNRRLSRAIADVGFHEFRRQIEYKAEQCGSDVLVADRFYPSSKRCSCCGVIKKDLTLSDRTYHCNSCGYSLDRDHNAAINLSLLATPTASSAGRHTPVERT